MLGQADPSKVQDVKAKPQVSLAQTLSVGDLEAQSEIDRSVDLEATQDLSYAQCLNEHTDEVDLNSTKQQAPGSAINEDVGRYVGFAWREFRKTGVGGGLLKLLFWKNNACFGWDADGVLLCKYREAIRDKNLDELKELAIRLSKEQPLRNVLEEETRPALHLLENLLKKAEAGKDLRDEWTALRTYYQEHSILTSETSVFIPYRYIVPLNIVFNWSLQNPSSYYTDIGLIWLCVFVVMIVGLIYAILSYDKKHKHLLLLSFATLIGWAIWWAIGGGIVWYGLGLILWSIFTFVALFQEREEQENQSLKNRYLWLV